MGKHGYLNGGHAHADALSIVLTLRGQDLAQARLRPGELVAATEAGATTIAIACARRCTVRRVADGPAATHGEGHITFS